jgi:hypothetical protein
MLMQSAAVLVIERSNVSRQHDEARGARYVRDSRDRAIAHFLVKHEVRSEAIRILNSAENHSFGLRCMDVHITYFA